MNTSFSFDLLFEYSQAVSPSLVGKLGSTAEPLASTITFDHACSIDLKGVYDTISKCSPEAKQAYWLARTWDLLSWQPIYLSFISIYGCNGLPDIKGMTQQIKGDFIAGYQINSESYRQGSHESLIQLAAKDLNEMFEFYRDEIGHWTRIRPGFTRFLFADAILNCIVKIQHFKPDLPNEYLIQQAKLWIDAANLPVTALQGLKINPQTNTLQLVRTSCCLVYKCEGRELCGDCPKLESNRQVFTNAC